MNLKFEKTCLACPEQYDVFLDGKQIAYIRLRHGNLSVNCPDVGGKEIYYHHFKDDLKGMFNNSEERKKYLGIIKKEIIKFIESKKKK